MAEVYAALRRNRQAKRRAALADALANEADGWTKHTEYHWSRSFGVHHTGVEARMDYWPSTDKLSYVNSDGEAVIHTNAKDILTTAGYWGKTDG